jgi:hypothetical protein
MTIKNHKTHYLILFLVWLSVHQLLFLHFGIRTLYDARVYITEADYLLMHGELSEVYRVFYSFPIAVIAFFKILSPHSVLPVLFFQCVVSGLAAYALYRSAEKIFADNRCGFFSALIYLIWWDNMQWNTVIMTESIAQSLICFLIYFLAHLNDRKQNYWFMGIVSLLLLFTRPTSVVILMGVVVYFGNHHWAILKTKPIATASLVVLTILIVMLGAEAMFSFWDFTDEYAKGNIITYADTVKGTLFDNEWLRVKPESIPPAAVGSSSIMKMINFAITNPLQFSKAALLKVWFLLSATRPYYSIAHNMYSLVWVSVIYWFFWLGLKQMPMIGLRLFVLTIIVLNCFLIGISSVDWDNRFYIPMAPGIIVLAGGGALTVMHRLLKRTHIADG